MAHKGKYTVKHPEKYAGDPNKVIYRSSWERRFMVYADNNDSIIEWNSEELVIPYVSPVDNRVHRYFTDFWVKVRDKDGKINNMVIEVKPKAQTRPPSRPKDKRGKYRYIREVTTWKVNQAKWNAAIEFCDDREWEFKILTEDHLVR